MSSRLAFQTQLASIMEVLANAAVAEICKLVDDDYAVVSLQMSQCQRENKALKRKLHLLELKMARGAAERRLRDSAANSSRPRVQIRESSSSTGGAFERQMNMSLWSSGGAAAGDAANQPIHSDDMQCKSPDVQLVEPEQLLVKEESVEANKVEEMEEDVSLIRDDGVLERIHRGASGQRASLEQDAQSQSQTQTSRTRPPARSSRGVEKEEEPDVVLVKVEEAEPVTGTDDLMGLSIQEGLVESSTDDYRGALAVDEATPAPINHLSELQESDGSFSEVSYGCSALWTNDGSSYCHDNSLLRPSSHCAPLSFMPGALSAAESGTSRRRSAGESSRSFRASFEQQHPVIDLSEESNLPVQASGHSHGGQGSVQGLYREPGPSQNQGSSSSADKQQRQQQHGNRKRVWICRFCGKGFMSAASLDSHTRTHTGERPYVCIVCGKKFSQAWNLKIHTNIHTGQRPYPCTICPERFSDPSNLKKHQKRLHPQT